MELIKNLILTEAFVKESLKTTIDQIQPTTSKLKNNKKKYYKIEIMCKLDYDSNYYLQENNLPEWLNC